MNPYYQDDAVQIFHGDCREILPSLEADVLVTDPPYGIAWKQHGGGVNGKTRGSRRHHGIQGDATTAARDCVLEEWGDRPALVFGSFRAPFPANVKQVLVHRKSPDAGLMGSVTGFRTDSEPIFLLGDWPKRNAAWSSIIESRIALPTLQAGSSHPHAKALDVLTRLIEACPTGTILDPFMGSGTTLRAAKDLGRKAIGIEIEERYCEIAARRLGQEVLDLGAAEMSRPSSDLARVRDKAALEAADELATFIELYPHDTHGIEEYADAFRAADAIGWPPDTETEEAA